MKKCLCYSVLRYSPSKVSGEKINLGIIFADEENDIHEFRCTNKLKRISSFDDELSIDSVKCLLKGIKLDVDNSLITNGNFNLEKYIQFYINDFYFDEPKRIYYDDWEDTVERINKSYFRFDYEKSERPSKDDDLKLLSEIIHENTSEIKKNQRTKGMFDENITFDFVTKEYKIKIMDFDDKDLSKLVNSAKSWALNCLTDSDKNILIIYRYSNRDDLKNNKEFESIKEIFSFAEAKFLDIHEGIQYMQQDNIS